jgi:glycolate oxidase iron-sulfur subunit
MNPGPAVPPLGAGLGEELREAGRCVLCGMCLPACPTYALKRDESESPRGRIALMRALASGSLAPESGVFRHLDACLTCRRCEAVCPAGVPFGALMDQVRARALPLRPARERWTLAALRVIFFRPRLLRLLRPVAVGVGMLRRARLWPVRRPRALALFPSGRRVFPAGPAVGDAAPVVALFRGCVAEFADADTLSAAGLLLRAAGFRVVEPAGQACCGALHQHAGDAAGARMLLRRNRERFAGIGRAPVVSTATGCGAWIAGDRDGTDAALGPRHRDIVQFLSATPWPRSPRFRPLDEQIFVHVPCSVEHAGVSPEAVLGLLRRVPGVRCVGDGAGLGCCGAAGRYMLTHPRESEALAAPVVERIVASGARLVVTTNIGCRLHLEAALRRAGWRGEVLHPVALLARRLENPGRAILGGGNP